jgi:hypothetical protein
MTAKLTGRKDSIVLLPAEWRFSGSNVPAAIADAADHADDTWQADG